MAEKTANVNRRVLLFPFPFQGHINPMLELAAVLHSRSFPITVFHTNYNYNAVDPAKYPSYHFIQIPDQVSELRSSSHDHVLSLIRSLNDNCGKPFHERLMQVLSDDAEREGAVPCLVLDMHWYKISPVAKQLGVPTLVLRTGSAASLNGFIALPALYRKGILPAQAEWQLELPVEELTPLRVRDMIDVGNDREELLDFVAMDSENARTSSGIIINTSHTIEAAELEKLQRDLSLPTFAIGPLHKFRSTSPATKSSSLLVQGFVHREQLIAYAEPQWEWLDAQPPKSVLYVSFGSLASMDPEDFTEMAWGLGNSGRPFLWVIRSGLVEGVPDVDTLLPKGFWNALRDRGRIVEWAPQREVLGHVAVGGFWTHCGWNSTVEAIAEGVPMICTPFFSDQMGNTRYVAEVWKVGVELRRPLERGQVERAVRRLMAMTGEGEGEGGEMRGRAGELQGTLCRCIQGEGSSHEALDHLVRFLSSL